MTSLVSTSKLPPGRFSLRGGLPLEEYANKIFPKVGSADSVVFVFRIPIGNRNCGQKVDYKAGQLSLKTIRSPRALQVLLQHLDNEFDGEANADCLYAVGLPV